MSCTFSRARRRQCAALALIDVIDGNISNNAARQNKTKSCLARISTRRHEMFRAITHLDNPQEFGGPRSRQYRKMIMPLMDAVSSLETEDIPMLDWLNAMLVCLEFQIEELPAKNKKQDREWTLLSNSICTLYKHFDKNLENIKAMTSGLKMGLTFRTAMEQI